MAQGSTNEGRRRGLSRRQFVKAASAGGATAGVASVAGCLGEAREQDTVVISGDSDFVDLMHADEGETGLIDVLYEVGLDEGIDVEVRPGPDDTGSRRQQYQSALQAGRSPPDIFMMDSGWALLFILREQSLPLDDILPSGTLDRVENDYLDAAVETAVHPETGELHALPLFPDFGTMQYRKDLVEDAGYDPEGEDWATEPISWERFAEVTADTHDQNDDVDFGFTTQAAAYEGLACCTFNETMSSWGGAYFGDHGNLFEAGGREPTVEEEGTLDAIRMMRAFMHGEDDEHAMEGIPQISPTAIVQWAEEEARGPFAGGNAITHRNWPYSIAISGVEEEFGEDLGVMPMPYGTEEGPYEGTGGTASALGGWHLVANPNSERIDEVVQVMEAFATDEVSLHMFEVQGWLPPDLDLLEDVTADEAGPVARYAETIQVIGENAVPRPVTDLWPEQAAHIFAEVHAAYRGDKSPEEAMGDLAARLERSERDVVD